jgi:hypothetical protein
MAIRKVIPDPLVGEERPATGQRDAVMLKEPVQILDALAVRVFLEVCPEQFQSLSREVRVNERQQTARQNIRQGIALDVDNAAFIDPELAARRLTQTLGLIQQDIDLILVPAQDRDPDPLEQRVTTLSSK